MVIRIYDPMAYHNEILLGQITKTSGFEGAVIVRLEKNFLKNIPLQESVFLEIEGRPVPFFISFFEYSDSDILKIIFEGYDSIEKVKEFKGSRVYLTSGISSHPSMEDSLLLIGYSIWNIDGKILGGIKDLIQNPGQSLLSILTPSGTKEILIPLHEDFIVSIDKMKKIIVMDLPDGLIDIN